MINTISGPRRSGKTTMLVGYVDTFLRANKHCEVLCVAPTATQALYMKDYLIEKWSGKVLKNQYNQLKLGGGRTVLFVSSKTVQTHGKNIDLIAIDEVTYCNQDFINAILTCAPRIIQTEFVGENV